MATSHRQGECESGPSSSHELLLSGRRRRRVALTLTDTPPKPTLALADALGAAASDPLNASSNVDAWSK